MDWLSESDVATIAEINYCKNKIAEADKQIKDIEFQKQLYTSRILSDIRKFYPILNPEKLRFVWNKFNHEDADTDETFKSYYTGLCAIIELHIIADTSCKHKKRTLISGIVACGYEPYGYQLSFICDNIEFILFVPVLSAITSDNMLYTHEGKYALYYRESASCISCIIDSYDIGALRTAFKEFITKKNGNKA